MLDFDSLPDDLQAEIHFAGQVALEILEGFGCTCEPKDILLHTLDRDYQCDCGQDIFVRAGFTQDTIDEHELGFSGVGFSMPHHDDCPMPAIVKAPMN